MSDPRWQMAIDDAQAEISKHVRRIRKLRAAVRVFQYNIRDEFPWPDSREQTTCVGQRTHPIGSSCGDGTVRILGAAQTGGGTPK
jgi:hypothetical protein